MALDFQLVDVQFTQGMDTRTDKKLVIPGKWNLLQNCNLSTSGALSKRDGVVSMLESCTGNGLATFNNELLAINGTVLKSVSSPTLTPGTIAPTAITMPGQLGFVEARKQEIDRGGQFPEGGDVAHGAGFTTYVWATYTAAGVYDGCYVTVLDEYTGTRVIQKTLTNVLGTYPRVVFSVDAFYVFYISSAAGTLNCRVITTTAGVATLGAETALITSASLVNKPFDCCEFTRVAGTSEVGVSYVWGDGATSVRAINVGHAGAVPTLDAGPTNLITEAEIPNAQVRGLGVCFITNIFTNYATFVFATAGGATSGTVVKILGNTFASAAAYAQVDATLPTTNGNCHVCASADSIGTTQAFVFTDQQSSIGIAASVQPLRRTEIQFLAGVITTISSTTLVNSACAPTAGGVASLAPPRGPFIIGKPISFAQCDFGSGLIPGRLFLPVAVVENYTSATALNTDQLQPTVFLLDAATGAVVSRALYGSYGVGQLVAAPIVYTPSSTPFVQIQATSANFSSYALAAGERGTLQFNNGINTTQNGVVRLSFTPHSVTPPIRTQLGSATYLAGGSLSMYDAQGVTEVGFPLFPEGIQAVVSAGGAVPAGTYQAVAVYEWVDGQGQRHQSAPSKPVSFTTTGGNQTVTITCPTLLLSQKTGVTLVLYVTQDAGTIFNRVTPMTAPVLNITTAVSVAFPALTLAGAITGAAGAELLYTQPLQSGTTLPSDAPGPTSTLAVHQNRLFVDVTDKPGAYRYSQALVSGVGLQWNETLGGTTPVDGGAIVGFADMDEKVIIFCARKIYVVVGTGPASSGAFSNYSDPIEIPSDTGCSDARSILKMPNGVVFKSRKGWHRVGRDLSVTYIGEGVYAYDTMTVFSACYVEDRKEARFSCGFAFRYGAGSPELGITLIYSYMVDQWSIVSVPVLPAAAAARTFLAYDAVWWAPLGVYVAISLIDGITRDTPGVFLDAVIAAAAQQPVIMTARTSFLHLTKLEGFQRVRWLYLTATYPNGTTATTGVKIVVDYDDVYSAVNPPGAAGTYTVTGAQLLATFGAGLTIDFRHKLYRQKCKSVAFTFSNSNALSTTSAISGFEALALEVGAKRGTNKLSALQTVA